MKNFPSLLPFALLSLIALVGCATASRDVIYSNRVYEPASVSSQPVPRHQSRPVYPTDLKTRGISGEAVVSFIVREDGAVTDVSVVEATDPRFAAAAASCVALWRFKPALLRGEPVACSLSVPIVFTLR